MDISHVKRDRQLLFGEKDKRVGENMGKFSRRMFLGQASAVSLCALSETATGVSPAKRFAHEEIPRSILPSGFSGRWRALGRLIIQRLGDSVVLQDGFAVADDSWQDGEFRFRARAPQEIEQVQIWAGIRCLDRGRRYVFALRGGNNNDLYLARYAPDGGIKFLGIAPLEFHPEPGAWYTLRAVARKNRLQLYLNDETLPRINVVDEDALWSEGSVSLGGGWLPVEFSNAQTRTLTQADIATVDAIGDRVFHSEPASIDNERRRTQQRDAYRATNIASFDHPRTEVPLNGKWLFLPDQELSAPTTPQASDCDDGKWHLMDVPDFWKPSVSWLYGETGFPYLDGVSAMKGISDNYYESEIKRLNNYTFDWRKTRSAWYRQYVDFPSNIAGRRFEICFDAIAMFSEVWVNGVKVASHTGMFGEVRRDVTAAIKPGRNVIAVHVTGRVSKPEASNHVLGVAVTVEVTQSMLNSLPHGMFHEVGGIWQPVRLIVTGPVKVDDVYIQPRLDGLDCGLTIDGNTSDLKDPVLVSYSIRSVKDGSLLYNSPPEKPEWVGGTRETLHFSASNLAPKLWSPHDPNLYDLEVTLTSGGEALDRRIVRFGFRTFTVENQHLLLNGKPFWLRGADHFPHGLRPNDESLAHRFIQLAREGNVQVTRGHTVPFTETWLNAADEVGMAVSYEGTWPWLMLRGDPPAEDLLLEWRDEFASLITKYRNHPSIIIWSVNNEMKFESIDRDKPNLLKRKWAILTDMITTIRRIDPTRPVVCDSSYCRRSVAKEYEEIIQPNNFDDGDIDDAHRYYGWYDKSFFHFFDGQFGKTLSWPERPLISQEMSTGYPRNDDGHSTRSYLFSHYTPQSLVGDEAYENRDPGIFLKRQAFMTKELAETFRRTNRENCAGILHFAYLTWFKDVWNSNSIQPFGTYYALKKALQPILVSAELYGRHFYAGRHIHFRVCVANDSLDGTGISPSQLTWEIQCGGKVIGHGNARVPSVPYYANQWINLSVQLPAVLPSPRADSLLVLRLESNREIVAENEYDITLATSSWAGRLSTKLGHIALFDPNGQAPAALIMHNVRKIASLDSLESHRALIVAGAEEVLRSAENMSHLQSFVKNGGRVLLLNAGTSLPAIFPDQIRSYRMCDGEIAYMHIPESPVFDGIEPLDLAWFESGGRNIPRVCRGVYSVNSSRSDVSPLAGVVDIHGYLQKPEDVVHVGGSPLVELRIGRGIVFASEMKFETASGDPIAGRLLSNLLRTVDCFGGLGYAQNRRTR